MLPKKIIIFSHNRHIEKSISSIHFFNLLTVKNSLLPKVQFLLQRLRKAANIPFEIGYQFCMNVRTVSTITTFFRDILTFNLFSISNYLRKS